MQEVEAQVKKYLQAYPVEKTLGELIRLDTQNPPGNERKAVEYILASMKGKCTEMEAIAHGGGRASLVVSIRGKRRGGTAFLGHLDTVPAGPGPWNNAPLELTVKSGMAYGRGTSDMKGGMVSILMALGYFLDCGITPERDVRAAFTADEESGLTGIRAVKRSGLLDESEEIIVGEPTDCNIGLAEKGALWIRVKAKGRQTHGAMPELGVNAVEMLAECLAEFKEACGALLEQEHPLLGRPSVSTTVIEGGVKCNIVPGRAAAMVDIRTTGRAQHEKILEKLGAAAARAGEKYGGTVEYEVANERIPLETSATARLVGELGKRIREAGREPGRIGVAYYTDLSGFLEGNEKPFAIAGPGCLRAMHKENEFIRIADIVAMAEAYTEYLLHRKD